jgi:hypothetical protein
LHFPYPYFPPVLVTLLQYEPFLIKPVLEACIVARYPQTRHINPAEAVHSLLERIHSSVPVQDMPFFCRQILGRMSNSIIRMCVLTGNADRALGLAELLMERYGIGLDRRGVQSLADALGASGYIDQFIDITWLRQFEMGRVCSLQPSLAPLADRSRAMAKADSLELAQNRRVLALACSLLRGNIERWKNIFTQLEADPVQSHYLRSLPLHALVNSYIDFGNSVKAVRAFREQMRINRPHHLSGEVFSKLFYVCL